MKKLILPILFNIVFSSVWSVDTTQSYIQYTGSHPLHSWAGISRNIDFNLSCDDSNTCSIIVSTPLESLSSGNDSRDSNMLWYTESLSYPTVSFSADNFKFDHNFDTSIDLKGYIHFHGIQREAQIKVILYKDKNGFWGNCKFTIDIMDYGIDPPSLLMIKISEFIEIETKLKIVSVN